MDTSTPPPADDADTTGDPELIAAAAGQPRPVEPEPGHGLVIDMTGHGH